MPLDITALNYFMPVFLWLLVFVIVLAVLMKTGLLGNQLLNFIIAFIIAFIFAIFAGTRDYIQTVTPWFAVILVAMLFVLLVIGLSKQELGAIMTPHLMWVFIIALALVFLIAAINVFPGTFSAGWHGFREFVTNKGKIAGAIVLLVIGGFVAWIVTKG